MKHIKDFFYDKNDIFIALIILVLAAGLILWRMDVIMEYPQTLAENSGAVSEEPGNAQDDTSSKPSAPDSSKDTGVSDTPVQPADSIWSGGKLTKDITVTIQGGTATEAVQHLVNAGLFESYDQFAQVCKAAGYTPEQVKATTFTFTAGSTQTDIAKQVTI